MTFPLLSGNSLYLYFYLSVTYMYMTHVPVWCISSTVACGLVRGCFSADALFGVGNDVLLLSPLRWYNKIRNAVYAYH